ncbi:MAG TPA: exosortase/archaeosortase family protein, partial [Candidatus Wunengus sp. YC60]|uniref:exosortase/archaeosortase family protein n=1 Tax=Candidatus Wunengus sp. YC60 TaxID=3367697 RepID=UPI0040288D94
MDNFKRDIPSQSKFLNIMIHAGTWILAVLLYTPVFSVLYSGRWKTSDYTHAYFILPIFFWLVWRKRSILRELLPGRKSGNTIVSFFVLLSGLGMYVFGWYHNYTFLTSLSLIPVLYGLIRCLYGREIVRVLAFPILYLVLIPPIPIGIIDNLTIPLRFGTSIATEIVLKFFHYPVGREGLLLFIGKNELFMGQACSGFRTIISMFSLALVYVYISKGSLLKKLLLGFLIIPLSVLSNFIRVIVICLITYYFGEAVGQGFFHGFSGILVFLLTLAGLLGLEFLLGKCMKQPKDRAMNFTQINKHPDDAHVSGIPSASRKNHSSSPSPAEYFTKGWIVISVLLITVIYCFATTKAKYVSNDILSQLKIPLEMNSWQGEDLEPESNLEEDKYNFINKLFDRAYVNKDGKNLYWLILDAGNFHNPKVCAKGAGFKVKELNNTNFSIFNHELTASCLYIAKGVDSYLMIYWICIDKNIVDWSGQKIKELWYSIINKK